MCGKSAHVLTNISNHSLKILLLCLNTFPIQFLVVLKNTDRKPTVPCVAKSEIARSAYRLICFQN